MAGRTLYAKLWDDHVVATLDDGTDLLWIDRHLIHEISTPQAFASLFDSGRRVRRPDLHLAIADHVAPTIPRDLARMEPRQAEQIARLAENCARSGVALLDYGHRRQGVVHVVGPETGFTLPGLTIACGDSHTSTHGALGALGLSIGTSECETVFATQCLRQTRAADMRVEITGRLGRHVSAKDLALALIAAIGVDGARSCAVRFDGEAVRALSMEGRMTLCNMTIEAGSRLGLIAPDDVTFAWIEGRPLAPRGAEWERALDAWRALRDDPDAAYARHATLDAHAVAPHVTWGVTPEQAAPIDGRVPDPACEPDAARREKLGRALAYMGLKAGQALADTPVDVVFIGSCANGRIEDLRAAAAQIRGRRVAKGVRALVAPGSGAVKDAAEAEGLDRMFRDAGFEWRSAGCSMCVGLNGDIVAPGARCASTSNRNFEGRQGPGARTHLMSPAMAAAAAIAGALVDVRED